jgi:hypothetical protein
MAVIRRCELCKTQTVKTQGEVCEPCKLAMFQLDQILGAYMEGDVPESWISRMVKDLDFMFERSLRTKGYFNAAVELLYIFAIDKEDSTKREDLEELSYSGIPVEKLLNVLESAQIIRINGEELTPGRLMDKLRTIRWEGYQLDTMQVATKLQEAYGIISIAITRGIIARQEYIPRSAMAILHLLSKQMLDSGDGIQVEVPPLRQDACLAIATTRQEQHLKYAMSGLNTQGRPRIIKDIDDEGNMLLKEETIEYLTNMRERYRVRERTRGGRE